MKTTIITCDKCKIKVDGHTWRVVVKGYKNDLLNKTAERDYCFPCYTKFMQYLE